MKRHHVSTLPANRVRPTKLLISVLALAILLTAVPSATWRETISHATAADDWPTLAHDAQRTGGGAKTETGPATIRWSWNAVQGPDTQRLSGSVQPVIAEGRVFAGTLDGTVVALDAATGSELWRARTGDAILDTAAVSGNRVYVGSQDGIVYAFDATTGTTIWTRATDAGVWAAPLVVETTVAIGSRDGVFYALDARTGSVQWSFSAGAPITMSAAYSARERLILVGAENSQVFALDLASGALRWTQQLPGQGFRDGWPVVADDAGLVIFRTMPSYIFQDLWAGAEGHLLETLGGKSTAEEQAAIRTYLTEHPDHQTFHALRLTTGERAFVAPVFFVGGNNLPPRPPTLDTGGGLLVTYSSRQNYRTRAGETWDPRWSADFGRMNLQDGAIAPIVLTNAEHGKIDHVWPFRLLTDEGGFLTRAGPRLILSNFESAGGVDLATNGSFHIGIEYRNAKAPAYPSGVIIFDAPPRYSHFPPDDQHVYEGIGVANSPVISAGGILFWRVSGGAIVAIGGTP